MLTAGNGQTLSVTFTPTDTTDYTSASKSVSINVAKATPTVSVSDNSGVYTGSAFTATDSVTGVSGSPGSTLEGVGLTLTYYVGSTASGTPLSARRL